MPTTIAFILKHGEAKVLITDTEFAPVISEALAQLDDKPLVIDIVDPRRGPGGERLGEMDYEAFLADRRPGFRRDAAATTNGTRSRSTTPRAPPATRRASSITTAAPI